MIFVAITAAARFTTTYTRYPQLVAQAVYAAFYHCFPDSRHEKFGPVFRKALVDTVTEW